MKNDKIMRWRIALSPYSYDIHYRPGQCNSGPDTFTRIRCSNQTSLWIDLQHRHRQFCML